MTRSLTMVSSKSGEVGHYFSPHLRVGLLDFKVTSISPLPTRIQTTTTTTTTHQIPYVPDSYSGPMWAPLYTPFAHNFDAQLAESFEQMHHILIFAPRGPLNRRFQGLPELCVCVATACSASATSEKNTPWMF